jgi:VanZ family protein
MSKLVKYYGLTILWALFVFIMCTIKLGHISESPMFFPGFDKLVHCGFIYGLVGLWSRGYVRKNPPVSLPYKQLLIILLLSILFGGLIELLQWKVFTWRDGDWADFCADAIGGAMATVAVVLMINALSNEKK